MIKTKKALLLSCLALTLFANSGCARRIIDFTLLSTKNVDVSRLEALRKGSARATGTDEVHVIIFIPTGQPNIKAAVDAAIESVPGAVALVDGVIIQESWWIPFIYGRMAFVAEGTPLIDTTHEAEAQGIGGRFYISTVAKAGERPKIEEVSAENFAELRDKLLTK